MMIYGIIDNDKFNCYSDYKSIDNDDYYITIDGYCDSNYLECILDEYKDKKCDFIDNIKDFISIYLYDKKSKELLIINDRIGAKKIYYCIRDNKLLFSNSLNKIVDNKDINIEILSMYFRHHFIPEPYTIYKDIYKLEHGYYMTYKEDINKVNYYNIFDKFNNRITIDNYDELEYELNNKLNKIIKELADNKENIGVYSSGGIDSNVVTSIFNKISSNNINTFSIGYEEKEFDESSSSKIIKNYLNTNHHEYIIKKEEALDIVKRIPDYYEEPFGDASAVSTLRLNEYAKKNDIRFALTGDGADQIFCGASIYDTYYKIQKASIINPLNIHLSNKLLKNKKLFYIFGNIPKKYKAQVDRIYKERKIGNLFADLGPKRFEDELNIKTNNLQEKKMILDLNTFQAQRVFPKMCIAAKKNNINIISPFLTHEMIEFSFSIPHKYKYHKRIKKYILKNVLYKYVPKSFFNDKKRGFTIPTVIWLNTCLNDDLKRVSTKQFIKEQGIFNYNKIEYIINNIEDNANLVWDYYMFQIWYEKNILNK